MAVPTGYAPDGAVERQGFEVAQLEVGAGVHRRNGGGHAEPIDGRGQIGHDALLRIGGVHLDKVSGGSIGEIAAGHVVVHIGVDAQLFIGKGSVPLPEHEIEHSKHAAKKDDGDQTEQYQSQDVDPWFCFIHISYCTTVLVERSRKHMQCFNLFTPAARIGAAL